MFPQDIEYRFSWRRQPRNGQGSFLLLFVIVLCGACASPQFVPRPTGESRLSPNQKILSLEKAGIIVNVQHADTPYRINRITTFNVNLVNPNDTEVDFYPKDFILWDQNEQQFFALRREALTEAAFAGSWYGSSVGFGFGYSYYHHPWHWGFYDYEPYPYYYSYEGLIARALPQWPITIFPHSTISGNVYFPVSPSRLRRATLVVIRFAERPRSPENLPAEITYTFDFDVIK